MILHAVIYLEFLQLAICLLLTVSLIIIIAIADCFIKRNIIENAYLYISWVVLSSLAMLVIVILCWCYLIINMPITLTEKI
jgi:hypothetical protein